MLILQGIKDLVALECTRIVFQKRCWVTFEPDRGAQPLTFNDLFCAFIATLIVVFLLATDHRLKESDI